MSQITGIATLKTVFLDRDGVINEEPGPILTPEQFLFIPRSIEAIRLINEQNWQCIVISNQAALARKQLSFADFDAICEKMNAGLKAGGAHIDALYYCPHHPDWDQGKASEKAQLCGCRKPQTGLLEQAAKEYRISPESSVFIGDTSTDFEAAFRWNLFSIGVRTGHAGQDGKCERSPNIYCNDLYEAVQQLIQTFSVGS